MHVTLNHYELTILHGVQLLALTLIQMQIIGGTEVSDF